MNNIKQKLIIGGFISSAALFTASSSYAEMHMPEFKLTPYSGIDVGMQHIGFKSNMGDKLFAKNLPKGNIFVGLKFNDYFGVEGGYESTLQKTKNVTLNHPFNYLVGFDSLPGDILKTNNKVKISGWHIGITGDYPFYTNQFGHPLSLIGYVGIKKNRLKLISTIYADQNGPVSRIRDLSENSQKTLFKLSAGMQYFLHKNFGIRALGTWENTSKFQPTTKSTTYRAALKNSISYSLGFVFKL